MKNSYWILFVYILSLGKVQAFEVSESYFPIVYKRYTSENPARNNEFLMSSIEDFLRVIRAQGITSPEYFVRYINTRRRPFTFDVGMRTGVRGISGTDLRKEYIIGETVRFKTVRSNLQGSYLSVLEWMKKEGKTSVQYAWIRFERDELKEIAVEVVVPVVKVALQKVPGKTDKPFRPD